MSARIYKQQIRGMGLLDWQAKMPSNILESMGQHLETINLA